MSDMFDPDDFDNCDDVSADSPRDDAEYYCSHCEAHMKRLTKWEQNFIESIRERLDGGQRLSPKQAEVLESIYVKLP